MMNAASSALQNKTSVISLGASGLDRGDESSGALLVRLQWQPVGDGSPEVAWSLAQLFGDAGDADCLGSRIDCANAEVLERILTAQPVWVDVAAHASEVWPDMGRTLLHAGPPSAWNHMCGPMKGAVVGAILYEKWATTSKKPSNSSRQAASASRRAMNSARSGR